MGRAIQWLAEKQLIHRDIKPGNIIRKPEGTFVLLDLGMAFDLSDLSLTMPGMTVGTLPYLSPEQLDPQKKRNMDYRSDTYSLGVTMYEAATGAHPYYKNGMSSTDTILSIQSTMPLPPVQLVTGFPKSLEDVIMRLLEKNPHLRYRSCARMIEALENVKGDMEEQN
jgi:serine/threonine protein kinase